MHFSQFVFSFRKLGVHYERRLAPGNTLSEMIDVLRTTVHSKQSKNVQILHLSAKICRKVKGEAVMQFNTFFFLHR